MTIGLGELYFLFWEGGVAFRESLRVFCPAVLLAAGDYGCVGCVWLNYAGCAATG